MLAGAEERLYVPSLTNLHVYYGVIPYSLAFSLSDPDLWIRPSDSCILTLNAGELVVSDTFSAGITLRFPRITRIRDDKKPHEIESEATLWERFEEVQQSRANADGHASLTFGPHVASNLTGPCRFLTEAQYEASKRQRKKITTKVVQKVDVVSVSKSHVQSKALSGVSFAVVGNMGFTWAETGLSREELEEGGWLEMAKPVRNAKSVERFIKEHGGTFKLSADASCDFVLGGNSDDPKVAIHIKAIENAQLLIQASKGKAKSVSAKKQEQIASCPGVLRWTFIYKMVHRWLTSGVDTKSSIKETNPDMLLPSVLDFLARPVRCGVLTKVDPGIFELDLSSVGMMRRALDFVGKSKQSQDSSRGTMHDEDNWRDITMKKLSAHERWVVATKKQALWPYTKGNDASSLTVIYPAIYNESLKNGTRCGRSSRLASVLPLARVMGAIVTTTFNSSVTHILCDLKEGFDDVLFDNAMAMGNFLTDDECCESIAEIMKNLSSDFKVTLVSPNWIRKRKWKVD